MRIQTKLALGGSLIVAGFIMGHIGRKPVKLEIKVPAPSVQVGWCDATHKIPHIPAEYCGGQDSCQRVYDNAGQPVDCNEMQKMYGSNDSNAIARADGPPKFYFPGSGTGLW